MVRDSRYPFEGDDEIIDIDESEDPLSAEEIINLENIEIADAMIENVEMIEIENADVVINLENDEDADEINENDEMIEIEDIEEIIDLENNEDAEFYDDDNITIEENNFSKPLDDSITSINHHSRSVFCGSIHPTGKYAISGGEDDKAYVWNVEDGNLLYTFDQHSDSVIIASFSFDGRFLVTADMAGFIQFIKCPLSNQQWEILWDTSIGDISWGFWHYNVHIFICSTTFGEIYIWSLPSGKAKILPSHGTQSSCGSLLQDGKRLAVGYDDGTVKIWDIKSENALFHFTPDSNSEVSSVNAIDTYHDNNLIIAGYTNGKLIIIKSTTGKSVGIFDVDSTVESVKFSKDPTLGLFGAGTLDGSVTIWDISRQTIRHICIKNDDEDASGITTVLWINNYFLVARLDGCIKIFDGKTGNLIKTLSGHAAEILDITYSSKTDLLLTTSDDSTCKIFKLNLPNISVCE